jgi:hypothetical protein
VDRCGNRKIDLQSNQVDACVFQLKEIGYLEFSEQDHDDGQTFRGLTLTEAGERYLSKLIAQLR